VPDDGGRRITQSLAIMEYIEEVHPTPSMLPSSALDRATVRQFAECINCE
jgi:maleylpyruvate isomerase